MSIGTKMQRAYAKSNRRQGKQEGDLIIRQKQRGNVTVIGGDYASYTQSDDILVQEADVSRVTTWDVQKEGRLKLDDLKFTVPGQFASEAQLKNAVLLYKSKTYVIVLKATKEVFSGIPVEWLIYGRTES